MAQFLPQGFISPFALSFTHSFFHFQTSSMNFSLPRSWRLIPFSLISFFSTTTWVAMPAWSQPGFHSVVSPRILCLKVKHNHSLHDVRVTSFTFAAFPTCSYHRVSVSWMALVRAWPRWSDPVTLGGGIHIMKIPRGFCSPTLFLCVRQNGRLFWCLKQK